MECIYEILKHLGHFAIVFEKTTVRIAVRKIKPLSILCRTITLFHYALCTDLFITGSGRVEGWLAHLSDFSI